MRKTITIAAIGAMIATTAAPLAPAFSTTAAAQAPAATQTAIERLWSAINSANKPLPAWAIDVALRAYTAYKTYRNGKKVEEVRRQTLITLQIVADLKEQLEAGRELTEREYKLTRELLDAQMRVLDVLGVRVTLLEREAARARARARAWHYFNRVCNQAEMVWRPEQAKCLHISVAGQRR